MTGIAPWLLAVTMLAAIGLAIGGIAIARRGERRKGVLMGIAALVLVANVAIWTI